MNIYSTEKQIVNNDNLAPAGYPLALPFCPANGTENVDIATNGNTLFNKELIADNRFGKVKI